MCGRGVMGRGARAPTTRAICTHGGEGVVDLPNNLSGRGGRRRDDAIVVRLIGEWGTRSTERWRETRLAFSVKSG